MSLDMAGFIDDVFESMVGTRTAKSGGSYVEGVWVDGTEAETPHSVNLQALNNKDITFLAAGGERIQDTRKVYLNDGISPSISEADLWSFAGVDGSFKCYSLDNRPWRNYCKFYAVRLDV